ACTGGVGGGSICPLTTLTPMCAMSGSQISAKHHCGEINLRWQKIENVKSYEIQKSFGSEGNYTTLLLIDQAEIPTYCPAGLNYCQYDDTEVVTVNNINPSNSQKYWYKIRAQGQDDTWSDWSTSINSFSYCYRSKAWQER
ncbi:hypothetical protein COU23_01355, partial [Candidatus Kuenenbacteria bacterium CG10_big_fil_rev_8_21_14_0_10_36_11]